MGVGLRFLLVIWLVRSCWLTDWFHPDQLLFNIVVQFVFSDVVGNRFADDLDFIQIASSHSGLVAEIEVSHIFKIDAHQFNPNAIGVHENVIAASAMALEDAVNFGLLRLR